MSLTQNSENFTWEKATIKIGTIYSRNIYRFDEASMVGQTVVEIIGRIIHSFTHNVAKHYDFDEVERNSYLIGCNPLEDTGLEWYCRPVDNLIYQEYLINREATTFDYLATSRPGLSMPVPQKTTMNQHRK